MRHERVYFTCEGCGADLPEEGHTEVTAVYTGYHDPTPNDDKTWELCAKCWLDVFAMLDKQDSKRREAQAADVHHGFVLFAGDEDDDPDDYRPWDHG